MQKETLLWHKKNRGRFKTVAKIQISIKLHICLQLDTVIKNHQKTSDSPGLRATRRHFIQIQLFLESYFVLKKCLVFPSVVAPIRPDYMSHDLICFQPDVGQDGFLTRMNRGLWCHMCPTKTHVTNSFVSVISRTGRKKII